MPVLSNTQIFTFPATLTLSLFIQIIPYFFNLLIAYDIPIPKQAGSAGGTVVVNKSKL